MSNYIFAAVVGFFTVWLIAEFGDYLRDTWENVLIAVVWTALLFYPLGLVFDAVGRNIDEQNARAATTHATWIDGMTRAGCKRTSYVATKSTTHAVWTCPDGVAHLEN